MRAFRSFALLGLLLPLIGSPLAAQSDTALTELVVDLRIDQGPSTPTLFALASDSTILLAAKPYLELAGIGVTRFVPGDRLDGTLAYGDRTFSIETAAGAVTRGDSTRPLAPTDAVWRDSTLYVDARVFDWLFGTITTYDPSDLAVGIHQSGDLPAVRRMARERQRTVLLRARQAAAPVRPVAFARPFADGLVIDWSASTLAEDPLRTSAFGLGLGADVLGGSAVIHRDEFHSTDGFSGMTTASWTRAWEDVAWLRQIRLGDVVGTGRDPRPVRGAAITNAPFLRSAQFGDLPLYGAFRPGWDVELFRQGELVDYATAGPMGGYRFDVPVQYGQNPVEVIGYGPNGQVITRGRTFEISADQLPARRLEYGVSGGGCSMLPCDGLGNADLRYGVSDRLTVQAGADYFRRDSLPDLWHPYAGLAAQPTRALGVGIDAVYRGLVTGRFNFAPTPDLQIAVAQTHYDTDVVDPIESSPFVRDRSDGTAFFRPGLWNGELYFRLNAFRTSGPTRTHDREALTATTRLAGARIDVTASREAILVPPTPRTASVAFDIRAFRTYLGDAKWLRSTLFLAEIGMAADTGFTRFALGFTRPLTQHYQVELTGGWSKGLGANLFLSVTAALPEVRAVTQSTFRSDGVSGTQQAEGSILWDRGSGRVSLSDGRSLGRAGVTGTAFLDLNDNGRRDPGEPPMIGVVVRVGSATIATDSSGDFRVWDLLPFESTVVEVDTLSIADPEHVPETLRYTVRPDPNVFTRIAIPFVRAGEVSGRIALGPRELAVAGVPLQLHNLDSGNRYTTTSFSDGTFYLMGVRPGRYEIVPDADALAQISATAAPVHFTVPGGAAPSVEGVVVRLERAP